MKRLGVMVGVAVAAAIVSAAAALPFIPPAKPAMVVPFGGRLPTIDVRGFFSLGTFWGWFNHMLIGGAVAAAIVLVGQWRLGLKRALGGTTLALVLGGALGAGADAASDWLCLQYAKGIRPNYRFRLDELDQAMTLSWIWPFLFAAGVSLAIAACYGFTRASLLRALIGVGLGGVLMTVARQFVEVGAAAEQLSAMVDGNVALPTLSFSPAEVFAQHILLAVALAITFFFAEMFVADAGLRALNGSVEGRYWGVGAEPRRIGCGPESEVSLPSDGTVAEVHAQVQSDEGRHYVTAVAGGVLVNGQPVQQAWLSEGDVLQVGSYRLRYGPPRKYVREPAELPVAWSLLDPMGRRYVVSPGLNLVGCQPPATMVVLAEGVVSRHATIDSSSGVLRLHDLTGGRGTFVNSRPVASVELKPGDVVRLGATELRVCRSAA